MLDNIDAVIFDLDGTLVDSMWIWEDIDREYLGKFQIPLPKDLSLEVGGMSFTETAYYFKERFQISDSIDQIKQEWSQMALDKYRYEVPLKKGAFSFLTKCKERGWKLGIATSNSRELVEVILGVHQLHPCFDCVITGCDVAKGKPAPDIYLAAASKLQVSPSRCLVFEDIVPGILAGTAAGMKVCAVEDRYSMEQMEHKKQAADYYIKDYEELESLFSE